VHNDYLNTFMEVGLFGWLLFYGFVGYILWCSIKAGKRIRRLAADRASPDAERLVWSDRYWFTAACQMAMVAVLIYCVQVDVFHFPLKGWWLIAALSWVMYLLVKNHPLRPPSLASAQTT
jgi:hypothetical protein